MGVCRSSAQLVVLFFSSFPFLGMMPLRKNGKIRLSRLRTENENKSCLPYSNSSHPTRYESKIISRQSSFYYILLLLLSDPTESSKRESKIKVVPNNVRYFFENVTFERCLYKSTQLDFDIGWQFFILSVDRNQILQFNKILNMHLQHLSSSTRFVHVCTAPNLTFSQKSVLKVSNFVKNQQKVWQIAQSI